MCISKTKIFVFDFFSIYFLFLYLTLLFIFNRVKYAKHTKYLRSGRKEVAEKKSLRDWVVCGGGSVTPHIEKK